MGRLRRASGLVLCALGLLLVAPLASASQYYGVGPNCKYLTIQAAIDALIANDQVFDPALHLTTIVLAGNTTFREALNINSGSISWPGNSEPFQGAVVQIVGGYDQTCDNPDPSAAADSSVIDAGTKSGSALFIHGGSYNYVVLSHLKLANANNTSGGATGGGINFTGNGRLDIDNVTIAGNQANYGAGIYAKGSGVGITLTLHSGTTILGNLARVAGGGIRIEQVTHLLALEPATWIHNNTANLSNTSDGSGGGISVYGNGSAEADIGSPGLGNAAVVDGNHARVGGGIAVQNGGGLRLFSTVAGQPAGVNGNDGVIGGGLYVENAFVCAFGYTINGNTANSNGSAIYATGSGSIYLTESGLTASSGDNTGCSRGYQLPANVGCPVGASCNQIDDNRGNVDAIETYGPSLYAIRFEARRNIQRRELLFNSKITQLANCLLAENDLVEDVIDNASVNGSSGLLLVNGCTIARNTLDNGVGVLAMSGGTVKLANSILTLNGAVPSAFHPTGSIVATDVIAPEIGSLSGASSGNLSTADPALVDPGNGNYHLRWPNSPAIDFHKLGQGLVDVDLDGNPRGVLLKSGVSSPFDIGAYELQSIPPCSAPDQIFCDGFESP